MNKTATMCSLSYVGSKLSIVMLLLIMRCLDMYGWARIKFNNVCMFFWWFKLYWWYLMSIVYVQLVHAVMCCAKAHLFSDVLAACHLLSCSLHTASLDSLCSGVFALLLNQYNSLLLLSLSSLSILQSIKFTHWIIFYLCKKSGTGCHMHAILGTL